MQWPTRPLSKEAQEAPREVCSGGSVCEDAVVECLDCLISDMSVIESESLVTDATLLCCSTSVCK